MGINKHFQLVVFISICCVTLIAASFFIPSEGYTVSVKPATFGKPLTTFESNDFVGSGTCALCHTDLFDEDDNDVSIVKHWRSTMMANAAKDPYWLAQVSAEVLHYPERKEFIEDMCAKCHMPMARTQAVTDSTPVAMFDDGFLNKSNPLNRAAMDGVSCTVCHQIDPDNLGDVSSFSGEFFIDTTTNAPNRPIYGPFDKQFTANMQVLTGYTPVQGKHMLQSKHCATCHTLFTPYLDNDGEIAGEFPEQTSFLEWLHSDYSKSGKTGKSCQDCHMPEAVGKVLLSTIPGVGTLKGREPFVQHHFVGGNVYMQQVLNENLAEFGLTADTEHFDATINRTRTQLQNRAANLTFSKARKKGNSLLVDLKIENITGHKFPTGFPSRRAWIELAVADAKGKKFFVSGKPKANGKITGNDNDKKSSLFEPHYKTITDAKQVQIYEAIMEDIDGNVTATLLRAAQYVKDNRLLPAGFNKKSADKDFAVHGAAVKDRNFAGGGDVVSYKIDVTGKTGPFTITAKLHYQSVSYRFIKDLSKHKTAEVKAFNDAIKKVKNLPEIIASDVKTVS